MATRPESAHPSRPPASEARPRLSAYIGSPIGSHPDRLVGWPVVTPDGSPLHLPPPVSTQVTVTISAGLQASRGVDITVRDPRQQKARQFGGLSVVGLSLFLSMENYRPVSVRYLCIVSVIPVTDACETVSPWAEPRWRYRYGRRNRR